MRDYWTDGPVGFVGFKCELKPPPSERQYLYFCAQREWWSWPSSTSPAVQPPLPGDHLALSPALGVWAAAELPGGRELFSLSVDVVTPLPSALRDMFQQRNLSLLPLPKELEGFHDVIWQGRGCLAKTLSGPSQPFLVASGLVPRPYLLPAVCDYWMHGRPFEEWKE